MLTFDSGAVTGLGRLWGVEREFPRVMAECEQNKRSGSGILARLDEAALLGLRAWDFGCRSLLTEYGMAFLLKAMLPHPVRTARGLLDYRRFVARRPDLLPMCFDHVAVPAQEALDATLPDPSTPLLLGLGFCLKPYDPANPSASCPSGRANHDCRFLETGEAAEVCSRCLLRETALRTPGPNACIYVMTSAIDMARDILLPQVRENRFPLSVLLLCPYSVQAMIPALFICRMRTCLIAYSEGSCGDYRAWRRADKGIKDERTMLSNTSRARLFGLLEQRGPPPAAPARFERRGGIYAQVGQRG